jgi:hypothetical protein
VSKGAGGIYTGQGSVTTGSVIRGTVTRGKVGMCTRAAYEFQGRGAFAMPVSLRPTRG